MEKNYLIHYGIPGMKWFIRRYQNEDGSYTDLGKQRRRQADSAFKPGKEGKPSKAEKITNSSSNIIQNIRQIREVKDNSARNRKIQKKIEKMTDDELRKKVNRQQLERQYRDLLSNRDAYTAGKSKVDKFLEVAVPVAAIGASATTIFATLYQIKKGM